MIKKSENEEIYEQDCSIGDIDAFEKELNSKKRDDFFEDMTTKKEEKIVSISKMLNEIIGKNNG